MIAKIVLSTWLIRVVSFIEPARSGWDLCLGRSDGVAVDVDDDGAGDADGGGMNPPAPIEVVEAILRRYIIE